MPETFITDIRRWVTELLRAETRIPVYGFQPDDLSQVPVLVVPRPGGEPAESPAVMSMSLDVTLLGRRIGDADAAAELDGHADEVFNALGGTRGVKVGDDHQLLVIARWRAGSVFVAGLEYPAYLFTVSYDIMTC